MKRLPINIYETSDGYVLSIGPVNDAFPWLVKSVDKGGRSPREYFLRLGKAFADLHDTWLEEGSE